MTVAEVSALLYLSHHPREQLERVLRIPALSPGWRWSFEELLQSQKAHPGATGNAGLMPAAAGQTAAPGFRPLRISGIDRECIDVISLSLQPTDGRRLTSPLPGQFVVLRLRPTFDGPPLFRSYSLSGPLSDEQFRVSVKVEPNGAGGTYLNSNVRPGDVLDVSEPRGSFVLQPGEGPVVLLSAGIGAPPVLAMLHGQHGWRADSCTQEHHRPLARLQDEAASRLADVKDVARSYVAVQVGSPGSVGLDLDAHPELLVGEGARE